MDEFTKAQKLFLEGYNCAQSVFAANADRFGIDKDIALKVSMGLGGGVGRLREVCGAFSACAMLVGLMETSTKADKERKEAVYVFVQKLAEDFKEELHRTHPLESDVLVPNCIYRAGCPEFHCCSYIGRFVKWAKDNNKDIPWLDIQGRYDLYNEYFYSTREEDNWQNLKI